MLGWDPTASEAGLVVEWVNALLDTKVVVPELPDEEYAALVAECARARSRLEALELRVVAAADRAKVAEGAGLASTGAWVAQQTRTGQREAARQADLARDLDTGLPATGEALRTGEVSPAHASVIADALTKLPAGLGIDQIAQVETSLVDKARTLDPAALRKAARRALASVEPDPDLVDAHEDTLLHDEETRALAKTRLTLHDNRDGTVSGHFTVPTLAGTMLRKVLDAMTAPRRGHLGATHAQAGDQSIDRDWAHERGRAFIELLEHLPTDHLHPKTAATVLVKLDLDTLQGQLRAAGLDTDEPISASDARRIACGAAIIPAVLDGASIPLDLGRSKRLYSQAQRVALALRHSSCAADGCDRPYAWCELVFPWSHGHRHSGRKITERCLDDDLFAGVQGPDRRAASPRALVQRSGQGVQPGGDLDLELGQSR